MTDITKKDLQLEHIFGQNFKYLRNYIERSYSKSEEFDLDTDIRLPNFSDDFSNSLADTNLFIILGMGGNGKTWLTFKQAYKMIIDIKDLDTKKLKNYYIPLTLLLSEITRCTLTEYFLNKISIHLSEKIDNKLSNQDFWSIIKDINNETLGLVIFIDDLGNHPKKCIDFFRELAEFVRMAINCGCKVVLNSRPINYYMKTTFQKNELFGLQAKIYNLPLFSVDEAYNLWKIRNCPQVYGLKEYLEENRFLCHPLILSLTINRSIEKGEWLPSYKFEVFELLIQDLFKISVQNGILKESQQKKFREYLIHFAYSVFTHKEEEFTQIPELHSFLLKYQLFYITKDLDGNSKFFHDTFFAYLLMLFFMPSKNRLLKLTKTEIRRFAKKIWKISIESEFALEIIEFSIIYLLNLDKEEISNKLLVIINGILDFSKSIEIKNKHIDNKIVLLLYYIGNTLRQFGYLDEAEKCFKIAVFNFSSYNFKPLNNLGTLYIELKEFSKSIDILTLAVEQQLYDFRIFLNLGNAYKAINDYNNALKNYKKSIAIFPFEPETWFSLGNIYCLYKMFSFGLECFYYAITLNSENYRYWISQGIAEIESAKIDQGIKSLEKSMILNPKATVALIEMGKAYIKKGEINISIEKFEKAIQLDPSNTNAKVQLGLVYLDHQKNYDEAIELFSEVISIKQSAEIYGNIGLAYIHKGEVELAMNFTQKAIDFNENYYVAYHHMAIIYEMKADFPKALSYALKAIELNEKYIEPRILIGFISCKLGKFSDAIQYLEKAIVLGVYTKHAYDVHYHLALAYLQTNNLNKVKFNLEQAEKLRPDSHSLLNAYGVYYLAQKNPMKAKDYFLKATSINPQVYAYWENLGNSFILLKNLEKAIECWEKSVKLNRNKKVIWKNLAIAYEKTGNKQKNKECMKEVMRLEESD